MRSPYYIQATSLAKVLDNDKLAAAEVADIGGVQRLLEQLTKRSGLDNAVKEFVTSQKEARDDYGKKGAVMLAPSFSGPYERRFSFRFTDYLLAQNKQRVARGENPVYSSALLDGGDER